MEAYDDDNSLESAIFGDLDCLCLTVLLLGGCSSIFPPPPQGASIQIQGPANDVVQWSAAQDPNGPSCICTVLEGCSNGGNQQLPSGPPQSNNLVNGPTINRVVDDSAIAAMSVFGPTPCMTTQPPVDTMACPNNPGTNPTPVACEPTNPDAAKGQVRITGAEETVCVTTDRNAGDNGQTVEPCSAPIRGEAFVCDQGTVSVTFDGQTVSAKYGCTSTPFTLGFQLAEAVEQNATLGSQFLSAPNGPLVYVNAINTGTQYDYPWTSSVSCSSTNKAVAYYGQCSFSVGLSPAASLTSP